MTSALQIIRIPILPFGMVNAHLILGSNECTLIDTGLPGSESKIEKVLAKHRLTFRDIKLIMIASGILLGGLVRTNHARRPPFEDDPRAVGLALQRLLDSGMERFYMGHGGRLPAGEVQRHAHALEQLPTVGLTLPRK